MTRQGPQYLLCGSRLTSDTFILRILLEGLSTQARHWGEVITIADDGSLEGLEFEVEQFKYLQHRHIKGWTNPNVVIAFIDRLSHNRDTEATLKRAREEGRAAFIISDAESLH